MELATLYGDIVERSPDAIWVCDLEGRTIYANPAMRQLYGVDEAEMARTTVYDSLDEQGRHEFRDHLDVLRSEGANDEDVDVLFWRQDGTSLWVLISERELRDEDGELVGFVHRISDYSGRRRALDELTESRRRLAEAHRIARLGSWEWDLATNEVTASDELCALYGLDPSTFPWQGADFLELVHEEDRPTLRSAVVDARHEPREFLLEMRVRVGDEWRWTRARGVSVAGDDGRITAMSGTHQDITEAKEADLALEDQVRQNALMQAVAMAANEAHSLAEVLAQAQHLVLLHDDWQRGRAFVPDETGEHVVPLYVSASDTDADSASPEQAAKDLALAEHAFRERASVWDEDRLTIAFPVAYADEVCAVITITSAPPLHRHEMIRSMAEQVAVQLGRVAEREAHERELADARDGAMEASRQKSEFLATMSHEIRTPLNGVIGLNDLLLRSELTPDQTRLASGVQIASRSLLAIINDVLDFSKIEAGMLELERLDFEVRPVFDQIASMLAESARAKGLELIVSCHPDVPEVLSGDPTRLAQVLANLGSNAVKFTETGEVFIRATATPAEGCGTVLHVSVTDTGVGVDEEHVATLFDAFTQADASTTRRYGGTGLGLAISREIVDALDGEIGLHANPGGGTVFWFTATFGEPAGHRSDPADELGRELLGGRRVLIVDDNDHNRLILEEQLSRWRIRTLSAVSADEAERALASAVAEGDPAQGVLLDMSMPGRDGLDLARALRRAPSYAGLTTIMLTSSISPSAVELEDAGIVACLSKPALAGEIRAALLAHLAGADPRESPTTPIDAGSGSSRRVLVVEDNPVNQLVAVGLLEAMGYAVTTADDGEAALAVLADQAFDAVLMDIQMPRMDGYAATRAIRTGESGDERLPIIAMTAAAVEGERERCLAAGMDDFLTKPVDPSVLGAALDRWTSHADAPVRRTLPTVSAPREEQQSDELGVLALDRLDELRDLDPGNTAYLDRAIGNFVTNTPGTLEQIRAAADAEDAPLLKQVSHKLAGGALNLGVTAAGRAAQQIELLADTGTTDGVADLIGELEQQLEVGRAALLAYQAQYSSAS